MGIINYKAIQVRFEKPVCYLRFHSPETNNTITDVLIEECRDVLAACEDSMQILVLEGLPEVFCFGADFKGIQQETAGGQAREQNPEPIYDLWLQLATGPCITIAHVRGKANAGGLGFVAACDIVLADETAVFSLSELLFGLFPACVLPFLIRRIGFQKAHYMTLMTQPVAVEQAQSWGLVDAYEADSEDLLRKHLLRVKRLSKSGILRYKRYMSALNDSLMQMKSQAITANREIFSDKDNLAKIARYVETGAFPWEE